jgi:hypothetical protein
VSTVHTKVLMHPQVLRSQFCGARLRRSALPDNQFWMRYDFLQRKWREYKIADRKLDMTER